MHEPPSFRFSVNLHTTGTRSEWVKKVRAAESAGFDVIMVPDHLGMPAPFSSLLLAAEAADRAMVASMVLNVGFYNPVVLAREAAELHRLSDGRLLLGLGAGYAKDEFETAGIAFESPGKRVDRLERTVDVLDGLASRPPLLIGGAGDRVLRLAARRAETVSLLGTTGPGALIPGDYSALGERAAFVRAAAGDRSIELNLTLMDVILTSDRRAGVREVGPFGAGFTEEQLLEDIPLVQIGSPAQIADRVRQLRDEFGISHFTVLEPNLRNFAAVIEELR